MTLADTILHDLTKNAKDKIDGVVRAFLDVCEMADVPPQKIAATILTLLISEAAALAFALKMSKENFLAGCSESWNVVGQFDEQEESNQ